jgi:hypothetical protein
MSVSKYYVFACDDHSCDEGPDATAKREGRNMAALRQELALVGWSSDSYGRDFCPSCSKRNAVQRGLLHAV